MKVLFAGGGTAGHINPALSIANYIKEKDADFSARFIGTKAGLETRLVPKAGYDISYIDVQGFNRKKLLKNVTAVRKLLKARRECRKIIQEWKPDAVVCTGGYVSGPVCMAAKKMGVPAIIHEQNVYPGLTVRGAGKYVDYVAVSFEETVRHMKQPEKCVVTGNPIRAEILRADRKDARKKLGLKEKPLVLVFGGSLGAGKINDTMLEFLPKAIHEKKFQLIFGTGERNYQDFSQRMKQAHIEPNDEIRVISYIDNMHEVMAAADLVVSRSGAITVSELAALGKPSILIPSPNVVRNHQEQNAREFEAKGAAAVMTEKELTPDGLYQKVVEMIQNPAALQEMSKNLKPLAKTDALEKLYQLIVEIQK